MPVPGQVPLPSPSPPRELTPLRAGWAARVVANALRQALARSAAKADVAARSVRCQPASRGDAVTPAVRRVGEVRAAADGLVRARLRSAWVRVAVARVVVAAEPVGAPLPGVAGHVVQPEAIGKERVDRAGAVVPVRDGVLARKAALPDIHPMRAVGFEL